jgi:FKBP-type peptidyl-prolyl cis-trans isomerase
MQNKIVIGIASVVAVAIVAYFFVPQFTGISMSSTTGEQAAAAAAQQDQMAAPAQEVTLPSGVVYRDEVVGTGQEAVAGKSVTVNYIGALQNGQVFDASSAHGQPFTFALGSGAVIKGWDEAVAGMKVGGKRLMQIPANMAYGAQAIQGKDADGKTVDVIPANSTLIFEVELLEVK